MPQLRDAHDVGDELRRIERRFARRRIARSRPDDGTPNAQFPSFPALVIMVRTGQNGLPNPYRGVPVSADIVPKRKGLRFGSQLVMVDYVRRPSFPARPLLRPRRMVGDHARLVVRSEEHTSELQSLMRISYAVFG